MTFGGTDTRGQQRLVVGVAQASELNKPRRFLLDLLSYLHESGHPADVALLRTGPISRNLRALSRVRYMPDPSSWSPLGTVESALRYTHHGTGGEAVRTMRLARRRHWLAGRPAVHLNNPQAVTLLRYLPEPACFVSLFVHPDEILGVGDLAAPDQDLLLSAVDWYIAADGDTAGELVDTYGVSPDRVTVRTTPVVGPHQRPTEAQLSAARRTAGLPPRVPVVAVPAVPDWVDHPDLTIALAWELRRRRPGNPPHVYWYGGPQDRRRRWPIEHELQRMRLDTVHLDKIGSATDSDLAAVALGDVVVLPTRGPSGADALLHAQSWGVPALCWSNHPAAELLRRWTGEVVPFPDVEAMAARVLALLDDGDRRAELGGDKARQEALADDAESVIAQLRGAPCSAPR